MTTTEFPYTDDNGNTVWACCVSAIGPTCRHRLTPDRAPDRFRTREDGRAAYGVWDAYLQLWLSTGLTEGDAELSADEYNKANQL